MQEQAKSSSINWGKGVSVLLLLAFALILSLATVSAAEPPRAHPALLKLAKERPNDKVRVIVQQVLERETVGSRVYRSRMKVGKKLDMINGFAAEMPLKKVEALAKHKKVRWVTIDAPVRSTASVPGFGTTGKVTTAIGSGADVIRDMAVQSDGKIVVAGVGSNGNDNDFAVARYNTNGSLDTTFDGDGKFTRGWGFGHDEANAVAIQPDGKIVVAGTSYNGTAFLYTLVRLNPNGSLDTTFDSDGIVTTAVNAKNNDIVQSVIVQSNGKIVAAGQSYNGSNTDFSLVRYNSNGSLDTTFNSTGKVVTAIGTSHDYGYSVAVQSDGKILVAGTSYTGSKYNFALVRYDGAGKLDKTFDGDGKLTTSISTGTDRAYGMVLQSDGKILVAGEANFDFGLVRYNTNGALDTTFDVDGKVTTPIGTGDDFGRSVALQADGKILVAGYGSNGSNNDFALVRYNSNGTLDTTFDGDGKAITALASGQDIAYSVKMQADGKIVVAGSASNGSNDDFAVVRYNTDGGLDCAACVDTGKLVNVYPDVIRAKQLWNTDFLQGQGITVAFVDSGVASHADFQAMGGGNSRILASVKFGASLPDTNDMHGHGTHLASIAGGNGNASNGARIGIAPKINLVNVRVSGTNGGSLTSDLVDGLQWIYNNRNHAQYQSGQCVAEQYGARIVPHQPAFCGSRDSVVQQNRRRRLCRQQWHWHWICHALSASERSICDHGRIDG